MLYDKLIRSKVPSTNTQRPKLIVPGMTKCNNCPICPFVTVGKTVKSTASGYRVDINRPANCQTKNILYCISCDRCRQQYVGESERTLQERFSKTTALHFSQNGHKVSDMKVTVLEKIFSTDGAVRKEREKHYIQEMNTKYKGLNRKS